jgi:hypothetical protein
LRSSLKKLEGVCGAPVISWAISRRYAPVMLGLYMMSSGDPSVEILTQAASTPVISIIH